MPWDKKMDQATLFEEAYKYVKFLQAQISALQSMPSHSTATYRGSGEDNGVFGELKKLNRKQTLQVVGDIVVFIGVWYTRNHTDLRKDLDGGKDLGMPDGFLKLNGQGLLAFRWLDFSLDVR
ncbi:hypothetical protein KIW84_071900 [Lathyrus oleraceus]|uniref:Uncharacterized protein n=1 Tax=Pisum sativum TaxID=3888 RepID=A0A9D4VJG5_PEA|nr:hypothetical protein KIW84_071900 [Pisum sativum]